MLLLYSIFAYFSSYCVYSFLFCCCRFFFFFFFSTSHILSQFSYPILFINCYVTIVCNKVVVFLVACSTGRACYIDANYLLDPSYKTNNVSMKIQKRMYLCSRCSQCSGHARRKKIYAYLAYFTSRKKMNEPRSEGKKNTTVE